MTELIRDYKDSHEDRLQEAWDYVQAQVRWLRQGGVARRPWPNVSGSGPNVSGSGCPCASQNTPVSLYVSVYLLGAGASEQSPCLAPQLPPQSLAQGPGSWRRPWLTALQSVARGRGPSSQARLGSVGSASQGLRS